MYTSSVSGLGGTTLIISLIVALVLFLLNILIQYLIMKTAIKNGVYQGWVLIEQDKKEVEHMEKRKNKRKEREEEYSMPQNTYAPNEPKAQPRYQQPVQPQPVQQPVQQGQPMGQQPNYGYAPNDQYMQPPMDENVGYGGYMEQEPQMQQPVQPQQPAQPHSMNTGAIPRGNFRQPPQQPRNQQPPRQNKR